MKHINQAMAAAMAAILAHHIATKVVGVELIFVRDRLQLMISRARYVQHSKATQLY